MTTLYIYNIENMDENEEVTEAYAVIEADTQEQAEAYADEHYWQDGLLNTYCSIPVTADTEVVDLTA